MTTLTSLAATTPSRGGHSRQLRVALIATITDIGGIEQVLLTELQHMDSTVELIPVLFTRKDAKVDSFFARLEAAGIPYVTFVNTKRRRYVNVVRNLWEAIAYVRRQRFDVVHCHGYRADVMGLLISKCFGVPVVSTCHGFVANDRALSLYNRMDRFVLRHFSNVIAVSARMKEDLVSHGVDKSRIHVIPNAVTDVSLAARRERRAPCRSRLGIEDRDFVFGFVGRLSKEKGIEHLVRAAEGFTRQSPLARFLIVGDGPERESLRGMVRELGLADRTHFVGFQHDTSEWYDAMDAFVLPSLTEGTPMALLEAMAHRLPVIATTVGGVPAVISHNDNGLLVPPADSDALLHAMRAIATDPALRQRVANGAGRTVRESYDVPSWIEKMRQLYLATAGWSVA